MSCDHGETMSNMDSCQVAALHVAYLCCQKNHVGIFNATNGHGEFDVVVRQLPSFSISL